VGHTSLVYETRDNPQNSTALLENFLTYPNGLKGLTQNTDKHMLSTYVPLCFCSKSLMSSEPQNHQKSNSEIWSCRGHNYSNTQYWTDIGV